MYTLRCVVILAASFVGTSFACEYPPLVAVPSGEDATMEELLATQAQIREYMTAMEEYLVCVNEETEAAGDNAPEEYGQIMATRHNAAVLEMETVAEIFNQQVQAFRAANPETGGMGMGMGMGMGTRN